MTSSCVNTVSTLHCTKRPAEGTTELPDSSTRLDYSSQNATAAAPELPDSSTGLDYSSQNATAAAPELPGGSSPETQQPEILFQIKNVVSKVELGCPLDLHFIAHHGCNVEYKPQVNKALIMRIRKPPATGMFHASGSLMCLGARSEEQSRVAARRFGRIVQKLGFPVRFLDFNICSVMAVSKTFPVRLEQLAHHQSCRYEPELFPAVLYKNNGISVNIFSSGKLCLTGAKNAAEVQRVLDELLKILILDRRP